MELVLSIIYCLKYSRVVVFSQGQTYSNGDIRIGHFNRTWQGRAIFTEKGQTTHNWIENWHNGNYDTQVHMYTSVIDKYLTIKVQVVCKMHSLATASGASASPNPVWFF